MNHEMTDRIRSEINAFHLPRYHEIPDIGLYLEQVSKYVSECFAPLTKDSMTGSMISNYVKRGVLSNPIKKQYSREQIASLICIAAIKPVLSMEDIKLMFLIQRRSYDSKRAYDYFCSEFENVLEYVFGCKEQPDVIGTDNTDEKFMLRNIVTAAAHALYLGNMFRALREQENQKAE
jgi:hypothetical protein